VSVDRSEGLEPEFHRRATAVIADLAKMGIEMRMYDGVRHPVEQAKLWRQSRTRAEIEAGIKTLVSAGATKLADLLDSVGPQHGRWATDAMPGDSWHQFGEACDCVWIVKGAANWSTDALIEMVGPNKRLANGYKEYVRLARLAALTPGGLWRRGDWPHIQKRSIRKPSAAWRWDDIEARMMERFGI